MASAPPAGGVKGRGTTPRGAGAGAGTGAGGVGGDGPGSGTPAVTAATDVVPARSVEAWVEHMRGLLKLEREAEVAECQTALKELDASVLAARGVTVPSLVVDDVSTGLFGRTVVTLRHHKAAVLPPNRVSVGDLVGIALAAGASAPTSARALSHVVTGTVCRVTEKSISVAADDRDVTREADLTYLRCRLDILANDITYRRLTMALDLLESRHHGPASSITNIMFGGMEPRSGPTPVIKPFRPLNPSQTQAIGMALASEDICMVHGPPGTGKTTTVVELIRQAVARGMKVLAVAPSNVAVDNIVERLAVKEGTSQPKLVRVGHPARMTPAVLRHCLDALIERAEGTSLAGDIRKELTALVATAARTKDRGAKREIWDEQKRLRKELRSREERVVLDVIRGADVVCTTTVGAASKVLCRVYGTERQRGTSIASGAGGAALRTFDMVVVDEAAQGLELSCWIPILMGKRCVLAGDHLQLPPTVKSHEAERQGLAVTLADRLSKWFGDRPEVVTMLDVQYRMHQHIMQWSSDELYGGRLTAHASVASHLLSDRPGWNPAAAADVLGGDPDTIGSPMVLVDTAGCDLEEALDEATLSKANPGEASIVARHVHALLACGVPQQEIAVITPYNAQVALLRSLLHEDFPRVEVRSVDGFQGQERDAVVLSFVRSNRSKEVGFLSDHRRINVAVTRARRHVTIVADSDTVNTDPFLRRLLEYVTAAGVVRSGVEYDPETAGAGGAAVVGVSAERVAAASTHLVPNKASAPARRSQPQRPTPPAPALIPPDDPRRMALFAMFIRQLTAFKAAAGGIAGGSTPADGFVVDVDSLADNHKALVGTAKFSATPPTLVFPPVLSSFQRMVAHEAAVVTGLVHTSVGEGSRRHMVVTCVQPAGAAPPPPPPPSSSPPSLPPSPPASSPPWSPEPQPGASAAAEASSSAPPPLAGPKSPVSPGSRGGVDVEPPCVPPPAPEPPQGNALLASLAAERAARAAGAGAGAGVGKPDGGAPDSSAAAPPSTGRPHKTRKRKKNKKGGKKAGGMVPAADGGGGGGSGSGSGTAGAGKYLGVAVAKTKDPAHVTVPTDADDPDMALLDAVLADSKRCAAVKCQERTSTMGVTCPMCHMRFCFKHSQAEVHGCGDAARAAARAAMKASRGSGGGKPKPALDGWKRTYAQNQLKKKLAEAAASRSVSAGDGSKSSKKKSGKASSRPKGTRK